MSKSQNGWPAITGYGDPLLHRWVVPGADTTLTLRRGCAGFVLVHLAGRFDSRVEELKEPVLDDWGYAYRPVRGYSETLSNHSSGTAMDLNATDHNLGAVNTFSDAEEHAIYAILKKYDDCIRWGGEYKGRKDEMHFELDRPLTTVNRLALRLMKTSYGEKILTANPGQSRVIRS